MLSAEGITGRQQTTQFCYAIRHARFPTLFKNLVIPNFVHRLGRNRKNTGEQFEKRREVNLKAKIALILRDLLLDKLT